MKNQLSAQTIWGIIGVFIILAVLGCGYYFNFVLAKETPVDPVRRNYNVAVIQEMQTSPNIFEQTIPLVDVPQSSDQNTQYQPTDLGKEDLNRYE